MGSSTLTVHFDGTFWVAVLERSGDGLYQAARIVLGAEPSDAELFQYLRDHHDRFVFGPARAEGPDSGEPAGRRSAKRALREARKEAVRPPGTKAQRALAEAREAGKTAARSRSKAQKEEESARLRLLKERKRKEKHRGR